MEANFVIKRLRPDVLRYCREDPEGTSLFNVRNPEQIRKLLDAGADINEFSEYGETPLIRLVLRGWKGQIKDVLTCAKLMIDAGVKLNYCDVFDDTALVLALKTSQWGLAKVLKEAGENLLLRNQYGTSGLVDVLDFWLGDDWTVDDLMKVCNQIYNEENWLLPKGEWDIINCVRFLVEFFPESSVIREVAKVAITKKRLQSKHDELSVNEELNEIKNQFIKLKLSGVVVANTIAEMKQKGKIQGDITPEKGKELRTQILREQALKGRK